MARRASRPLRLWRLALLLAAALVPCLTRTAEYVPNGESGGFIRLAADEHGGADTFSVSLARKDGAPAAAAGAIRPQTLLCQRDRGGWLIYAGGWPEDLDGTYDLLVRCGAADDARIIRLPDAIRRRTRRMDVALLLDDSRSMRTTDPQRLRVAAARLFAQMAALRGNIETLTIVAFNRRAHLLLPPTPPGDSAAVDAALERLEASGATDLDSAFALAYEQLDRLPSSHKIAVVLSDGRDEPGHYTFGHRRFSARQWPVHTIGLSDDIDEQCLQMIAASTGGAYHRAHSTEALARIFRDIAAALQSGVTVGEWHLDGGDEAAFPVDDTLRLLSLALLDRTEARSACALQAPDGTSHALSSTWATDAFADLFAPAAGNWQVKGIAGKALLSVTGVSSLELVPFPVVRPAETNKPMPVTAFVMEGSQLLKPVRIVAQLPDGTAVTLHDDGLNADGAAADGIYGAYLSLKTPEQIRLSLTATGQTAGGQAFQRFTYRELEAVIHAVPITGATTRIIPPATLPGAISRGPAAYPLPRPADTAAPPAPAKPQTEYAFAGHGRAAPLATIAHEPQLPVPNAVTPAEILLPLDAEVPPEPPEEEIESPAQSVEQAEVPEEEQASEPVAEEGAPSGTPADDAPSPAASAGDAQPARLPVNLWKIVLLIAAIIFLCWMIWRWFTRPSMAVSRMASFFLVSLLLHGILAILLMDLLVQTRVITVEQISPQLAISLQAIESSLGIQLTPPGPAVPLAAQSAGATEVARATMQAKSTLPQTIEPSRPATDEPSTMRAILEPDIPDPDHAGMTPVAAPETPAPPPTPEAPTETLEAVRPEAVAETPPPQQEPEPVTLGRAVAETPRQPLPPAPTAMPRQMDKPQPSRVAVTTPRTAAASRPITSVTMIERPELPASPSSAAEPDAPVLPEPIKVQTAEQTPETPTPKSLPRAPAREIVASQAPDLTTAPLRPTAGDNAAPASVTHATPQAAHGAPVKAVPTSIAATANAPSLPAAPTVKTATPEPVQPLAVADADTAPATPAERPQPVQLARTTSAPHATVPQQAQGLASVPLRPAAGGSAAPASVTHATPQPARGAPVKTVPTSIAATADTPSLPAAPTVAAATPEPVQPLAVAGADTAPAAAAERPQPVQLARTAGAPQATVPQQAQGLASVPLRPVAGGSAAPASVTHATPQPARGTPVKSAPTSIAATGALPRLPNAPLPGAESLAPAPVAIPAVAEAAAGPALSQGPSGIWLPRPEHGLARAERTSQSPGPRPQPTAVSPSPPLPEMALPSVAAPQQAGTLAPMRDAPLAFQIGSGSEVSHRVTIGLAQYGGDWDWARHAMTFLGHQLRERTRMAINAGDRVVRLDSPDLARLPFVYMTGHKDFRLSDAEVANLRAYLLGGGYLWADDSTHFNDETFDTAFRRELARILPEAPLERLDMTFEGFRTGYDLTRGYKGYAIPPGDKYRLDYIEGARLGDRVAVVYTRNDYGDGLNIDEYTHPLHTSLTDLSPAEMQEGAVRMGINLTLYFLTHGKGEATFIDRTAATLRQRPETDAAKEPAGTARPLPLFAAGAAWQHEDWSDAGQLNLADATARLNFTVGAQRKCALSQQQEPPVEVTAGDIVAIRVRSGLRGGARVALAFTVAERYFESRPVYIKPGENLALFPCGEATFKTEAGGWAYRDQLPARAAIQRITLLVYSPTPGELHLSHPRIIRAGQQE
ncbi:MAG: DUF4159 domain-containing protein [Kiritimatiellia bacterium]|jgi:Mg-chelatase subunit ChlD